jgi:hypothetical protein
MEADYHEFKASPVKGISETLSQNKMNNDEGLVKSFPNMYKALGSVLNTKKKKKENTTIKFIFHILPPHKNKTK